MVESKSLVRLDATAPSTLTSRCDDSSASRTPQAPQNATPGSVVSYQWYSSTVSGTGPWTPVGTNAPTFVTNQTAASWYYCDVTCSVGPVSAIVIDVIHPGVRATGASVLALFQNLFGLAAGPFLVGVLSDGMGLQAALTAVPMASVLAAVAFTIAARSYEGDKARAAEPIEAAPRARPAAA